MSKPNSMSVYWPTGRNCYYCQWRDPLTGKKKTLSTGKTDKWEATQFAADQAGKLSGDVLSVVSVTWAKLCEEYKADRFQSQRRKTQQKTEASMRAVADLMDNPTDMLHFGTAQVRKFKRLLRQRSISDRRSTGTCGNFERSCDGRTRITCSSRCRTSNCRS
jgi:hypothetical protein